MAWYDWFRPTRPAPAESSATLHAGLSGWGPPDTVPADTLPTLRSESRADNGASIINNYTGLGSANDKGTVARPNPYVLPLSLWELRALYVYNGIARRIIDLPADRACRRGWSAPELASEDQRLRIPERVNEAMRWSRLYGAGILVPVTTDDIPPAYRARPDQWLEQPLDPERVLKVEAVQVFDGIEAKVLRWDLDPKSPTFRLPLLWRIGTVGYQVTLHASRVVHIRGSKRPPSESRGAWGTGNGFPDDSALQAIWDELRRLGETLNGGAVLAQELREAVLKLDGLSSKMTSDDSAALDTQLQLMSQARGLLGMTLIGTGDDFQTRANPPTGFSDLSAAAWEALAAVTGIPQVILMGSTPGGLNTDGESSWQGFHQLVSGYQEEKRHEIERLYQIVYSAQDGPTGGAIPDEWHVHFAPLDEPNEATMAETRARVAETDDLMIKAGVLTPRDVTLGRYGPAGWNIDLQIEPPTAVESDVGAALRGRGGLAILPQFVGAGIISDAAARELLGFGEDAAPAPEPPAQPPPDPAQPGAAPGQPLQTVQPPLARVDAVPTDACVVLIPAADPGLRGRVEAAIGQTLVAETDPHVTVLYVGTGLSPEAIAEVVEVVGDEVAEVDPAALLTCPTVRVFPPGPNGTPIVLEYGDAWAAAKLNGCLLRVLAHVITAKQHASYRPHLTLGYAPEPVSPEAQAALLGIDTLPDTNGDAPALRLRIPIGEVQVRVGDQVVLSTWAGMDPPEPGDLAPPAGFTRVRGHLRRQGPQEPEPV